VARRELEALCERLKGTIGDELVSARAEGDRRATIELARDGFKDNFVRVLEALGEQYISAITGVDCGDSIEVIYHLWSFDLRAEVSVKVRVPMDEPRLPTICDVLPGAVLYEREVHDLLGVTFEGHPNLKRLVLPEDWPEGVYPLRKNVPLSKVRKLMLGEGRSA